MKPRSIIIEGCDGTGKTTLAKILAERYGMDICHCTADDPKDFEFYKNTARKNNVIWDRHAIGELIYPKMFDRKQEISAEDASLALCYARENHGKVIVLTALSKDIRNRLSSREIPEDSRIMKNTEWIDEQFLDYADKFHIPVINTSYWSLQDIFNLLEKIEKIVDYNYNRKEIDFNRMNFYDHCEKISDEIDAYLDSGGRNPKEKLMDLLKKYHVYERGIENEN